MRMPWLLSNGSAPGQAVDDLGEKRHPVTGMESNRRGAMMRALSVAGFTNIGYWARSRSWSEDAVDLSGKTMVVTGATSGIGLAAAMRLAGMGAAVVLVGRNPEKLGNARSVVLRAAPRATVRTHSADLSLVAEVEDLADRLLAEEPRLHALINNAGALFPERSVTAEGIERTLATNLLGHFVLTNLLIPRLVASAPARIINVSSGGMYGQRIDPDDLQSESGYRGTAAYARSKRGQVILTEMWAEQLLDRGVVVHAMHPGWARTPGVETSLPRFNQIMGPFLRTPEQGADTSVWLAASSHAGESTGGFWLDRKIRDTHFVDKTRETETERHELWSRLEALSAEATL
jgi:NAD(P)-dependent dehydrogenase (short-subunit alcohol dehydrogenase family)